ncbi:MAG: type II toxin-antitoxin system VapC family toxin [Terracidiphilus sp.]
MAGDFTESGFLQIEQAEPNCRAAAVEVAFRSDQLAEIRKLLNQVKWLEELIGPLAEFRFVVDTNILLYQVLWPLKDRRNPDARTDLEEALAAGTVQLYATPEVIAEVDRNLSQFAARYGVTAEACDAGWSQWKAKLRVREADPTLTAKYASRAHPADAPTVALAESVGADGVLSRDKHIKQMGGTPIQMEFVLELRNYSRQIVVSASIRVGSYFLTLGTLGAVAFAVQALRSACEWFARLPDAIKLISGAVVIALIVHPNSRDRILSAVSSLKNGATGALPYVMDVVDEIAKLEQRNRVPVPIVPIT